jgi:hypothetical protein
MAGFLSSPPVSYVIQVFLLVYIGGTAALGRRLARDDAAFLLQYLRDTLEATDVTDPAT